MPASLKSMLSSNQNSESNELSIHNPLRGMSGPLASNLINTLGVEEFLKLANHNNHITGIYEYLVGQEIPDRDYVDFFHKNQFDIVDFLRSKHAGVKGYSNNITNYIEYRYQTITKHDAGMHQKRQVPCFHNAALAKVLYGKKGDYSDDQIEYIKFLYADCLAYLIRSYDFQRKGLSQASIVVEFFESLALSKKDGCVLNGGIATATLDFFGGVEGFISAIDNRNDGYNPIKIHNSMREYFYAKNREHISEVFENIAKKSQYSSMVESVHKEISDEAFPIDHVAIGIYEESSDNRFSSSPKVMFIALFIDYLLKTTMDLFNGFLREREKEQRGAADV